MKKSIFSFIICSILVFSTLSYNFAQGQIVEKPDIKIYIDGQLGTYTSVPILVGGSTLLPLREILVNLGVMNDNDHIIWNSNESSVTIKKDNIKVYLKVGDVNSTVNDVSATLTAAPVNYNGKVYIPARFVAQSFGKTVEWDSGANSVIIGGKPDPNITQVEVSTATEFVKELGSNKRIVLKPGEYNLSSIAQTDSSDDTIKWITVNDGKELNLQNISNLAIEGSSAGLTEIKIDPRFAEIMNFTDCNNIAIKNITAGHTPSQYDCNAGVMFFKNCSDISINNCDLYGCGSEGIGTNNTKRLNCNNSVIEKCSLRAIDIYRSESINFTGCKIINHGAYSNIIFVTLSNDVNFKQCEMSNNNNFKWSFIESDQSNISIDKCKILNNTQMLDPNWDAKIPFFKTIDYKGTSGKIVIKDSEISNNKCYYLLDNKDNVTFENCTMDNNVWNSNNP